MSVDLPAVPAYERYELRHMYTGTSLYTTTATQEEILQANSKLAGKGDALPYRFFPQGGYSAPLLHTPGAALLAA